MTTHKTFEKVRELSIKENRCIKAIAGKYFYKGYEISSNDDNTWRYDIELCKITKSNGDTYYWNDQLIANTKKEAMHQIDLIINLNK